MSRYIDVDAALKRFEEIHGNESDLLNCYNADWIVSFIETQPTADVQEVRHGRWIFPRKKGCVTYDEVAYKECSECGEVTFLAKTKNSQMNYCQNCGAKMDGGESE